MEIIHYRNHYAVIENRNILCECDTYMEAKEEMEEMNGYGKS